MNTKDLAFNDCTDTEVIKYVHAVLPGICVSILTDVFIIEPIDLRNLSCFVIPSQKSYVSWIPDFETHEELESFD